MSQSPAVKCCHHGTNNLCKIKNAMISSIIYSDDAGSLGSWMKLFSYSINANYRIEKILEQMRCDDDWSFAMQKSFHFHKFEETVELFNNYIPENFESWQVSNVRNLHRSKTLVLQSSQIYAVID